MNRTLAALVLAAACSSAVLAENEPAYKALRVYGKKFGEQTLNEVTEVRGRSGVPQPPVWKISGRDTKARGGVREVEIQGGRIISERSPSGRDASLIPMNLNQLNLDSDGAFTVADKEMEKKRIPFDRIDYVLRTPSPRPAPVWFLDLHDGASGKVATMEIAADTGSVLSHRELQAPIGGANPPPPDYSSDRDFITPGGRGDRPADRPPPRRRLAEGDRAWSRPGESFRGVGDFFHRLGRRMERRGDRLKGFFGGDDDRRR